MRVRRREAKEGTWRLKLHMANLSVIYSGSCYSWRRGSIPHTISHLINLTVRFWPTSHDAARTGLSDHPPRGKAFVCSPQPSPAVIYACTSICCCLSVAIKYRGKYFMFSQLWDLTVTLGRSHSLPPTVCFCLRTVQWVDLVLHPPFTSCEIPLYLAGWFF